MKKLASFCPCSARRRSWWVVTSVIIEPLSTLHAQVSPLEELLEVLSGLSGEVTSGIGIMLLNVQNDIQSHHVHQLKRSLGGVEHATEDGVDFFWCRGSFRCGEESLSLDGSPDSAWTVVSWMFKNDLIDAFTCCRCSPLRSFGRGRA